MQLTREQYAIAESLGCRFLPATESQIHRLSMQQRIFWLDGKAFVVSRRDGFHETAGTLRRLLAHAPAPGLSEGPSGGHAAAPPTDAPPAGAAQAPAPQASLPQDAAPREKTPPAVEAPPAQDAPASPPPAAAPPAGSVAKPRRAGGRAHPPAPEQPALALQEASPDTPRGTTDSQAEATPGEVAAQPVAPPEPEPVAASAQAGSEEVRADAAAALLAGAGLGSLGVLLQPGALARKRPRKQIPGLLAPKKRDPVSLTVQIVAAHVSNNAVQTTDLPNLIAEVHRALTGPMGTANGAEPGRPPPVAASLTRRRAEGAQKGAGKG
ncbi:Transcriptional regulator [Roseomonas mucosa]|uniref:ROS/MUCR transcriptional regulator protein n=1 Tax=Roseomonas mucosa TaxID=207340 RepID=A0A1S8D3M8_9PROT|nr:hypothetical protein CTJ15_15005 [Roseomonas sp. FDAARGOS_362]ONH82932.1 hypothetical protein APZ41_012200 [Roseomonas mucosa]UZO96146.1 Transcriptional regulator [Roseomonas mucosa]GAV35608.1 ROSMUCR transcriptional regulator protein [Roseomonas sp. TAS13]